MLLNLNFDFSLNSKLIQMEINSVLKKNLLYLICNLLKHFANLIYFNELN